MATREQIGAALQKAHEAGDTEHARILAQAYADAGKPAEPIEVKAEAKPSLAGDALQSARDLLGGGLRGAGSIGSTILWPVDKATDLIKGDRGKNLTGLITGQQPLSRNEERRQAIDEGLKSWGADPESTTYKAGKLGAEIAGAAGLGGALAPQLAKLGLSPALIEAVSSGGMKGGDLLTRAAGGAIAGAAGAGAIDPKDAATGAALGAILPGGMTAAKYIGGKAGALADEVISPFTPNRNAVKQIEKELIDNFPAQAPSLLNRMPDGVAGPSLPKFGRVEGAAPTAGMLTDNPQILKLEQNARLRNPEGFFSRDAQNTGAVYRTLEGESLSDLAANQLQDGLNARTGALRDEAFEQARANPVYREQLQAYLENLAQTPGIRASESMPLIERARRALIMKPDARDPAKILSDADPEDIYTLRKMLNDKLSSRPSLAPDEMDNALKANRRLAVDMKGNIDASLNEASGGAWEAYLKEHQAGMQPIEQGRAFQNILDKFDASKKIFGTDIPQITPAALRKAAEKETYINLGKKGDVSKLDAASRAKLDESIQLMNAIEQARGGMTATNGSQTAPFITSLMRNMGGSSLMNIAKMYHAIGATRGQQALDNALLNPGQLQGLLDQLNAKQAARAQQGLLSPYLYKMLPALATQGVNE